MTSSARIHVLEDTALPEVFRLGGSRVDLNANVIETAGREHRITPKAAAVMAQLAAGPGRALTRDELLRIVWADAFPTDDVLSHAITELRRALGDDARNSRFIETIPKVGYRLLVTPEPVRIADPDSPARPSRLTGTALGFAAGLLSGVLATALVLRSQPTVDEAPAIDPLAESFPVSAGPGPELMPAIAPDGGRVAFVSATAIGEPTDIHVKSLVGEVTRNVTQSRGIFEYSPAWSPDGQSLAFLRFEQGACRVIIRPVDGGLERDVGACIGEAITYVDWSPDGRQLALTLADMEAGVSRINLIDLESGGTGALDYTLSREHDVQPKFSPDGQTIAFRRGVNPRSELFVVSASGGRVRALTELGSRIFGFDWLPDSDRIWFCAQRDGAPSLFEVSLANGALRSVSGRCPIGLSIAAAGDAIAFEDHAGDENLVETAIDGSEPEAVFVSTRAERDANYAPDGSRLVFVSDRSGEDQLWLGDRGAGEALQLTRLAGLVLSAPRFAPDGESIVFVGRGGGQEALYEVNLRSGIVEVISAPGERVRAGAVGPDGAYYLVSARSGDWQLWRFERGSEDRQQLTHHGSHRPFLPGDGFVYFTRLDRYGVWRVPVNGGEEELVTEIVQFATHETWVVRGEWLYAPVYDEEENIHILRLALDGSGGEEKLLSSEPAKAGMLRDVSPDGERFLFSRIEAGREDIVAVVGI